MESPFVDNDDFATPKMISTTDNDDINPLSFTNLKNSLPRNSMLPTVINSNQKRKIKQVNSPTTINETSLSHLQSPSSSSSSTELSTASSSFSVYNTNKNNNDDQTVIMTPQQIKSFTSISSSLLSYCLPEETKFTITSPPLPIIDISSLTQKAHRWRKILFTDSIASQKKQHLIMKLMSFSILAYIVLCGLPMQADAFDLGRELDLKETRYTELTENISYISSTKYHPRGMQPLYNITHEILRWFIGTDAIPKGYLVVTELDVRPGPKVEFNEWGDLIKHYWAILLVVILTALLVTLMPIVGLCFCCCRCAGACGGRSQPFDKKHDTCRRVFLGFLLICAASGLLFGVIVAFATNSLMQEGIDEATTSVRYGSNDTQKFLKATSKQIDHLLVNNYKQLSNQLEDILGETSLFIITQLEEKSMAVSMKYLTDFLVKLPEMRRNLERMKSITNELRTYASQLSDGLRGVKRELLVMLSKCVEPACKDVLTKYEIGKLDASGIHYDQLPDVTEIINNVNKLINDDIASAGNRGRDALLDMRKHLNETIIKYTPQITSAINKAGDAIHKASSDINDQFSKISSLVGNHTNMVTYKADTYLEEYSIYRFYIGIGISSILLLILTFLTAALCCGVCGKRPDGYGDDCCNKGSGSRFLMLAVAVIFLTISALAAAALVHFLVGLILQRGVCLPLRNPQNDDVFQYLDNFVDLNNVMYPPKHNNQRDKGPRATGNLPPFRISHVITACKANQTIYEVLQLHNLFDINDIYEYPAQYKINQTLADLVQGIDFNEQDIVILSGEDRKRILNIANSSLKNFDSEQFTDNLNDNITQHSLLEVAQQLRSTVKKITRDEMKDVVVSLRNQALHLETYEQNLVIPMKNLSVELISLAQELESSMRYKDKPFEDSIPMLVAEIDGAERFINKEGRPFVKSVAKNLTEYFSSEINRYLRMVVQSVQEKIGKCGPLANVYDSLVVGACKKFVDPLNGFWAGVTWCILIFLPTLVISVKLSSLYQKSDPYPGPLVESEYLYDAYSERDHIPLANGPKNKRRKQKDRRRTSRDRRADYYEDSGSSSHGAPPTAGVRDTRYNDMAPKHWDGGPPRYTNPPMAPPASEYERPPPYYYPGAAEQD